MGDLGEEATTDAGDKDAPDEAAGVPTVALETPTTEGQKKEEEPATPSSVGNLSSIAPNSETAASKHFFSTQRLATDVPADKVDAKMTFGSDALQVSEELFEPFAAEATAPEGPSDPLTGGEEEEPQKQASSKKKAAPSSPSTSVNRRLIAGMEAVPGASWTDRARAIHLDGASMADDGGQQRREKPWRRSLRRSLALDTPEWPETTRRTVTLGSPRRSLYGNAPSPTSGWHRDPWSTAAGEATSGTSFQAPSTRWGGAYDSELETRVRSWHFVSKGFMESLKERESS